jgi:hypothetical protein
MVASLVTGLAVSARCSSTARALAARLPVPAGKPPATRSAATGGVFPLGYTTDMHRQRMI